MFSRIWELLRKIYSWLTGNNMTAPAYETDLSIFNLAENTGTVEELAGTTVAYNAGGTPVNNDTDDIFQGNYHASAAAAQKSGVGSIAFDYGSGVTVPTNGAFFIWHKFDAGALLDTIENGGVRACVGSSTAAFKAWKISGKNAPPYPTGGWYNHAIDPTLTPDYTEGSPSSTLQHVGMAILMTAAGPSKGQPHKVDGVRFGRGEARIRYGDGTNGYATFSGFAAANDAIGARWGLIQAVPGGYQWKGLMTLGYSNAVDFRDSNAAIFVQECRKVSSAFNKIEIRQATSRVDWTGINITCTSPSTTASKGALEVIDDCDVNFSGCTFTDMDTFIFKAASDVLASVFRRCNTITANDAKFAGTLFDSPSVAADTSALVWDVNTDPNTDLNGCTFVKGANAHHAIEFGLNSPTSMTLTNVILTGFSASNNVNDSALHFKRTSGTVTLTISGGTAPSYRSDGATIVIVTSSRTVKAVVQTADGTKIGSARVLLKTAAAASGGFPYDATVTITNSGTTATVSHTSHGMLTNDKVVISGASLAANNGVFTITKTGDNSYTYDMASSPGSDPTGTIKCSFVFLEGLTDTGGEISMSRAIGANQNVVGWARKSSAAPYYKTGPLSGVISTAADTTLTAILSLDG